MLILSGGLDSTVLLASLLDAGDKVDCLSFAYGQRHSRELKAAADVCTYYGVRHDIVELGSVGALLGDSALLGGKDVPEGHYEHESMKATIVPNRNMIFLSIAAGVAIARRADAVAYGAHSGDRAIYPDCRGEFAEALARAVILADEHGVQIRRPFVDATKVDIVRLGDRLAVPFQRTWSCYRGAGKHCGKCGTCAERKEAFEQAGVQDPTEYA